MLRKTFRKVQVEGVVREALKDGFRVEIIPNEPSSTAGPMIIGHLSGRIRLHHIHVVPGDRVKVDIDASDLKRGRITYRYR